MSVADFLKGLPSHNALNFSQFNTEHGLRTSQKRPSVYLPTEEELAEQHQHIVMDKRCVLLRYLSQQWDKKQLPRKREHNGDGSATNGNTTNGCKKRRLEPIDLN